MNPASLPTQPVRLARLSTADADFDARLAGLLQLPDSTDRAVDEAAARILADVRARGDAAVLEYTARFDRMAPASVAELAICRDELRAAFEALVPARRQALEQAAWRVQGYHERQRRHVAQGWAFSERNGTRLGQKVTPLDRVGLYVPGGKAAYPSSVLMNALPARVAGVGEIVMVVPTPGGERNPLVLAAAHLAGVARVFAIGGAQAIGALAYGTAAIPKVDKICGPGNAYVASAKRQVFGTVGIDMIAGPSEILVLADGSTPPDWVALDLFSQAEHDELAQSILLSPDAAYLDAVQAAIERLLPQQPRREVIAASLAGRGALIATRSMEEACAISNRIAPEHLEIAATDPRRWEPLLVHAGAIFLGAFSSEALGDYCAGPNHVLPTAGTARFSSPLGVYDFVKRSSLIEVSAAGAQVLGPVAGELADGEGLPAHAAAARARVQVSAASATAGSDAGASDAAGRGVADRAPGAAAAFEVRDVGADDAEALMKLAVAPDQQSYVAPNSRSLAQAAYQPLGRPLGLWADGRAVGFLLLYDARWDTVKPASQLYVWRLMVDAAEQGRGHGRRAMQWVVEEARRMGMAEVGLSHVEGNAAAGRFYESLGFRYTGEVDDGELSMVLDLAAAAPPER